MNYSSKSSRILAVFIFPWAFSILNALDGINTYLLVGFLKVAKEANPFIVWSVDNWGWEHVLLAKMLLSMIVIFLPLALRKTWEEYPLRDKKSLILTEVVISLLYLYVVACQAFYMGRLLCRG